MIAAHLIAVPEAQAEVAGAIVWWRMSGTVSCDELAACWDDAGLDPAQLPSRPTPAAAMGRAVQKLRNGRTLVRPLAEGGRAVVSERATGQELDYTVYLRATVDPVGRPVFDPPDHWQANAVRAHFDAALDTYTQGDIGSWLVRLVEQCDGVRLRDTGGVYFVPAARVAEWRGMVNALHAASAHRINGVPAMRAEDAVASILDALEDEARTAAGDLEEELQQESFTAKKAQNRVTKCEAVAAKVKRYEAMLGAKTRGLHERLADVRSKLVAATLMEVVVEEGAR